MIPKIKTKNTLTIKADCAIQNNRLVEAVFFRNFLSLIVLVIISFFFARFLFSTTITGNDYFYRIIYFAGAIAMIIIKVVFDYLNLRLEQKT
jgi:hypothetical protein